MEGTKKSEWDWTPGPWHTGDGKAESIIYSPAGYAVGDARTHHGRSSTGEQEANARLIAAAPELFEALEDAEFLLRMLAERPEDLGAMRDSLKRCGDDARAALAKAKGDA
jgi:hypothetical protein